MARPTIADLAEAAGVSPTTVSHAFSGKRYVEPQTRDRILALAEQMGYRANPRARRLRTGGASIVAIASSMPPAVAAGPSRLGFFMEIAAAAALTATSHALALCLMPPLQSDFELDSIEVDGAVVIEPMENDQLLEHFLRRNIPVVSIGRVPGRDDLPWVDMQSAATTELLLEHLWREGGRIGLITGEQRRNSYIEAEAVYAAFAAKHGFTPAPVRVDEAGGEAAARDVAAGLLEYCPDIDALCVPVDAFAIGVLDAARDIGRSVPKTLRVATRYDGMRARLATPLLTAVNLRLENVAEAAIELLIGSFKGTASQHPQMPKPEVIARASSAIVSE